VRFGGAKASVVMAKPFLDLLSENSVVQSI
jgi:hypothetical protein